MSLSSKVYLLNFLNTIPRIRDAAPAMRDPKIANAFPVYAKLFAEAAPTCVTGVAVAPGPGVAVGPGAGVAVGPCVGVGVTGTLGVGVTVGVGVGVHAVHS